MHIPEVNLRPATQDDFELTFAWANDAATRRASFESAAIARSTHRQWFAESLAGRRELLIAELDSRPVGLFRLDRSSDEAADAEVALTVAPGERGAGLAALILEAGATHARSLGYNRLLARIRTDNPVSRRVFERAGYSPGRERSIKGVQALELIRSITDA